MDYIFNNTQIYIETARNNREEMKYRLLVYMISLRMRRFRQSIKENNTVSDKAGCMATFWDKESNCEQKIYGIMTRWEARHPIIGIVLCTILGGIFISLVAGIVLEVIMMTI